MLFSLCSNTVVLLQRRQVCSNCQTNWTSSRVNSCCESKKMYTLAKHSASLWHKAWTRCSYQKLSRYSFSSKCAFVACSLEDMRGLPLVPLRILLIHGGLNKIVDILQTAFAKRKNVIWLGEIYLSTVRKQDISWNSVDKDLVTPLDHTELIAIWEGSYYRFCSEYRHPVGWLAYSNSFRTL